MIADLINRLIGAGTPADVAAVVVAEAYSAGMKEGQKGLPKDETAERRRAYDRYRIAEKRRLAKNSPPTSADIVGHPPTSADCAPTILSSLLPLDASLGSKKQSSEPRARGHRLPDDWEPSDADMKFAAGRGLRLVLIEIEATKFRNYWTNRTDKQAAKLNWSKAWQNWILNVKGNGNGQAHSNGLSRALAGLREHVGSHDGGEEGREPPPRLLSHG